MSSSVLLLLLQANCKGSKRPPSLFKRFVMQAARWSTSSQPQWWDSQYPQSTRLLLTPYCTTSVSAQRSGPERSLSTTCWSNMWKKVQSSLLFLWKPSWDLRYPGLGLRVNTSCSVLQLKDDNTDWVLMEDPTLSVPGDLRLLPRSNDLRGNRK